MTLRRIVTLIAVCAVVAALPRLGFAQAVPQYSIINVNPTGTIGTPTGINDDYQVVGNDATGKGFVWMPGVPSFHFDPTVSDTHYYAYTINNLGEVGGTAWNTALSAAVSVGVWAPSTYFGTTYSLIYSLGGVNAVDWPGAALALNDDDYLCGTLQDSSMAPKTFDGVEVTSTTAVSYIADNYEYTGISNIFEDMCGTNLGVSPTQAIFSPNFFTPPSTTTLLAGGTFGGVTYATPSVASGIDDADNVVGAAHNSVTGNSEAFAWNGRTGAPYGPLGFLHNTDYSVANAINTSTGIVIGQSGEHAFLWSGDVTNPSAGAMTDLNSLVQSNSGWRLVKAVGLNDDGAIVGTGYYQQKQAGFIAIPVIISSITMDSPSVVGGNTLAGTITLDAPAPFDMNVTVTTYSASLNFGTGIYSAGVVVLAGDTTARFVVHSTSVTVDTPVTLKATFGGWRRYAKVDVLP
ncbi:MAG: hypothetical protein KGJ62_15335 [Armatimonadetes bacterium]|nr:hypothetical protein [Armatimonadota bacterium]MDE2207644.1 hypothetical protein [Armatimonadota bacterium]